MSQITTHVLDTSRGRSADGVRIYLELLSPDHTWQLIGQGTTDEDGRLKTLVPAEVQLKAGTYRLIFNTEAYFAAQGSESFYPAVAVIFRVRDATQHYHIPLLLNPFGYSTYRGS